VLQLSKAVYNDIIAHSLGAYPHECCGVLLGKVSGADKRAIKAVKASNKNEARANDRYEIDPVELNRIDREARAEKLDVLGFYHSHPDHPDRPSGFDRERAFPFYSYIIVAVSKGVETTAKCWTFEDEKAPFEEEELRVIADW
jgi:proteasome lid subunit RPN8/RPN11